MGLAGFWPPGEGRKGLSVRILALYQGGKTSLIRRQQQVAGADRYFYCFAASAFFLLLLVLSVFLYQGGKTA
jgi:hypothetical protein